MSAAADPPVVVCLHGLDRSPADWDGVRHGLKRFGEVRTPALPRVPGAAIEAVDAAVPAGAIVIAHSFGGVLALRLAAERGRRFEALVLTDAFFPPTRNGRTIPATLRDYASHRVAYLRELRPRRGRAPEGGGRRDQMTALASLVRLALRRAEFDAAAASVTAPVLVVHARDDHYVPVEFALGALARHPGWSSELLARGGHHAHVTEPRRWLDAIVPWLEQL